MKKLSVLIIILAGILSACQSEKVPENSSETSPVSNSADSADVATTTDSAAPVVAATSTETITATDTSEGESLHKKHCTRCHGSDVYTRTDHKAKSLDALGKQVRMCDSQLETQLFPEDMEKLTHYLNQTYYKF